MVQTNDANHKIFSFNSLHISCFQVLLEAEGYSLVGEGVGELSGPQWSSWAVYWLVSSHPGHSLHCQLSSYVLCL